VNGESHWYPQDSTPSAKAQVGPDDLGPDDLAAVARNFRLGGSALHLAAAHEQW
jgi:hypothetical protein